jgi:hypothetical protein
LTEFRFFLPENEGSDQDSAENNENEKNEAEGEQDKEEEKGEIKEDSDKVSKTSLTHSLI